MSAKSFTKKLNDAIVAYVGSHPEYSFYAEPQCTLDPGMILFVINKNNIAYECTALTSKSQDTRFNIKLTKMPEYPRTKLLSYTFTKDKPDEICRRIFFGFECAISENFHAKYEGILWFDQKPVAIRASVSGGKTLYYDIPAAYITDLGFSFGFFTFNAKRINAYLREGSYVSSEQMDGSIEVEVLHDRARIFPILCDCAAAHITLNSHAIVGAPQKYR